MLDEFPRGTIGRRSFRGDGRKHRAHVRHRFRIFGGRVVLRKRNQSNNRKDRKDGYYDEEFGEGESKMAEALRTNRSGRNNASFHIDTNGNNLYPVKGTIKISEKKDFRTNRMFEKNHAWIE